MRGWHVIGNVDVLDGLCEIDDESVQCCVTSPPYWGLRDYGLEPTEWPEVRFKVHPDTPEMVVPATTCCLGLEKTPIEYVAHMVLVFREVRRVLRSDGTLWLNLGDSYAGGGGYSPNAPANVARANGQGWGSLKAAKMNRHEAKAKPAHARVVPSGLKSKDLIGIPWRVAFALQADGWYLRSDVVWAKPSPMPESVRDRPTRAHEYVFLLTKSASYFFDQEAVREPMSRAIKDRFGSRAGQKINARSSAPDRNDYKPIGGGASSLSCPDAGRNLRTVWTITPKPLKEAHFATMPPDLAERCVKAGTSEEGCCPACKAPWKRVTFRACENCEAPIPTQGKKCNACGHVRNWKEGRTASAELVSPDWSTPGRGTPRLPGGFENKTVASDWRSTCACDASEPESCVVLDPFSGAGTTALVALRNGCSAIGIEKNPSYIEIAERRIAKEVG